MYCAVSILLTGNMKLERTLRSLTACFFCRLKQHLSDTETTLIASIDTFERILVRGNEAKLVVPFFLCFSLGCQLTIIRELINGTFQYLTLSPNEINSVPKIGVLLLTQQGQFWPLVPTAKAEKLDKEKVVFPTNWNVEQILGHQWTVQNFIEWDKFPNVECFVRLNKEPTKQRKDTLKQPKAAKKPSAQQPKIQSIIFKRKIVFIRNL